MKIKNIKKAIGVTLSLKLVEKTSFFVLESKNKNTKNNISISEHSEISSKTFIKIVSKNVRISEFLSSSVLKFPLVLKSFKTFESISNYLFQKTKEKNNLVVFIKISNVFFKENSVSLISSLDTLNSFNSLSRLLDSSVNVLKLFNLSKN
jgi:hypothetical protein